MSKTTLEEIKKVAEEYLENDGCSGYSCSSCPFEHGEWDCDAYDLDGKTTAEAFLDSLSCMDKKYIIDLGGKTGVVEADFIDLLVGLGYDALWLRQYAPVRTRFLELNMDGTVTHHPVINYDYGLPGSWQGAVLENPESFTEKYKYMARPTAVTMTLEEVGAKLGYTVKVV